MKLIVLLVSVMVVYSMQMDVSEFVDFKNHISKFEKVIGLVKSVFSQFKTAMDASERKDLEIRDPYAVIRAICNRQGLVHVLIIFLFLVLPLIVGISPAGNFAIPHYQPGMAKFFLT
ncbi:uncharacterized protein LOC106670330 [Cimex lectularius]|uniref:Uncharacterized protein n=1 Tax=Cimex lectularius TaxID=79782 RepID=A0A8I6S2P5_CIMLE|nr:uncharacterized protein LOC106670330 [Cimex lectularius]